MSEFYKEVLLKYLELKKQVVMNIKDNKPVLIDLNYFSIYVYADMIIWMIGNIIEQNLELIETIEKEGIFELINTIFLVELNSEKIVEKKEEAGEFFESLIFKSKVKSQCVWFLVCYSKYSENLSRDKTIIITNLLCSHKVTEEHSLEFLWALTYLTDTEDSIINHRVFKSNYLYYFINMYYNTQDVTTFIVPLIRLIGNLVMAVDDMVKVVEELNIYLILVNTLKFNHDYLNFLCIWVFANLSISTKQGKAKALELGIFDDCISKYIFSSYHQLARESAFLLGNTISECEELFPTIVNKYYIPKIVKFLTENYNSINLKLVLIHLEGIYHYFIQGENSSQNNQNNYINEFIVNGGNELIDKLASIYSKNNEISGMLILVREETEPFSINSN